MTAHVPAGPNVAHFTLNNGLEVVVIPDHRAPVVTHMIWYRNGAADDPVGKSGIAHFLEHLMFKGTKAHPKGEFSEFIAEPLGEDFALVSYTADVEGPGPGGEQVQARFVVGEVWAREEGKWKVRKYQPTVVPVGKDRR